MEPNQLTLLLQLLGGSIRTTDVEFDQLCVLLRHHGHITDGTHGNVATVLHGPLRQARP